MKRLAILGVVLVALAGIAWGGGAIATEAVITRWLDARAAEGWLVNLEELSVGGFPTVFRTRLEAVDLADPVTGWAWSAPDFVLEQDALRLDRLRAVWPGEQTFASPDQRLTVTSASMTSTLDVQPLNRLALDASDTEMADVTITSNAGWQTALETGRLTVVRQDGLDYTVDFLATGLTPTDALRDMLDPAGVLPAAMEQAHYDAVLTFDRAWDLSALETARPQITRIDIAEMNANWGDMLFRASGVLEVDGEGIPTGDLSVRAENWEAMVDLAANAGLVPERLRPTAEAMLRVLASMSGRPENIDATLSFSEGRVYLGPLPLGPAPSLRLR